jgi:hypothetical protein
VFIPPSLCLHISYFTPFHPHHRHVFLLALSCHHLHFPFFQPPYLHAFTSFYSFLFFYILLLRFGFGGGGLAAPFSPSASYPFICPSLKSVQRAPSTPFVHLFIHLPVHRSTFLLPLLDPHFLSIDFSIHSFLHLFCPLPSVSPFVAPIGLYAFFSPSTCLSRPSLPHDTLCCDLPEDVGALEAFRGVKFRLDDRRRGGYFYHTLPFLRIFSSIFGFMLLPFFT